MSEAPVYPTAHEVAVAIVAATRAHNDDPVRTIEGVLGSRGRYVAFAALASSFPLVSQTAIARLCGFGKSASNASSNLKLARKWTWWRERDLKTVKAALADAIAVTDAELRNRVGAGIDAATAAPLPDTGGDADPAPEIDEVALSPFFGVKSDALEAEIADFSHLRDAPDRARLVSGLTPRPVSAAARSVVQRSRIIKTQRGRIIDHRQAGVVDMGDPAPGRSALDQRGAS